MVFGVVIVLSRRTRQDALPLNFSQCVKIWTQLLQQDMRNFGRTDKW